MIRQSSMDHTTPAPHNSPRTVGARVGHPTGCDTPTIRHRRIRQHDELDLPLYQASLAGDVATIRRLCPQTSARRAMVMAAIAGAFTRVETGWNDGAFYTVVFDDTLGVWRRVLLFSGPVVAASCAVCGRPSVYRLRDTPFCRMHGPDNLDRSTASTFLDPIADRSLIAASASVDMPHNH